MINKNEMRLGSMFQCCDNYYECLGALPLAMYYQPKTSEGQKIVHYEDVQPIPLTEEWLKRCGYEFNNETFGYISKKHIIVISQNDDELIFMPFCTNDEDCYLRISYVHQLQNILFVFGEELNITG